MPCFSVWLLLVDCLVSTVVDVCASALFLVLVDLQRAMFFPYRFGFRLVYRKMYCTVANAGLFVALSGE